MSTQDRRTLWHRHCRCGAPTPNLCACIDTCICGCLRVQHEYDGAPDPGPDWGACDVPGCGCMQFELHEERALEEYDGESEPEEGDDKHGVSGE